MTVKEVFEGRISKKIAASEDDAATVYQFSITGDDGGDWVVDLGNKTVSAGTKDEPDCGITMTSEDFMNLVTGKVAGTDLFMGGKLKITGNMMYAMQLNKVLG